MLTLLHKNVKNTISKSTLFLTSKLGWSLINSLTNQYSIFKKLYLQIAYFAHHKMCKTIFFCCKIHRHFLEVICLVQYLVATVQKVYCRLKGTKNDTILAFSIVEHFENSGAYYGLKCTSLIVLQLQNADVTTVKCRWKLSISKNL